MKKISWEIVMVIVLVIVLTIVCVYGVIDRINDKSVEAMKYDMVESMVDDINSNYGYSTKVVELTEIGRSVWEDGIAFDDLDGKDYIIIVYDGNGRCVDKIAV